MQRRTFSENTFLGVSNSVEELKEFTIQELAEERQESEQEIADLDTTLRAFTTTKFNESKTHSDQQDTSQSATLTALMTSKDNALNTLLTQRIYDENAAQSASLLSQMDIKDEAVKTFARARANHTGTQLASTISDFSARVTQEYATGNNPKTLIDFDDTNRAKLSCHRTGGMVFDINNSRAFTLHQSLYSPLFHEITIDRLRYITISAGQNLSFMTETGGLIMRLEDFQGGDASDGKNNALIEIFTAIDMNDYKISNIGDLTTKGVSYSSSSSFNDYYNNLDPLQKQSAILPQSEVQSLIDTSSIADRNRTNHTGTQLANTISDFQAEVSLNTDLVDATDKKHTHANKAILDGTQESFTTALKTKLDSAAVIDDGASTTTTVFSSQKTNSNINVNVTNARNFAIQRVNHTGTQLANTISDFQAEVSLNTDLVDATDKKHTHANKAILDAIEEPFTTVQKNKLDSVLTADDLATNSVNDRSRTNHTGTQLASTISDFQAEVSLNTDVSDATLKKHIHGNKAILDNISFALTAQDKVKIDNATMVYDAGAYPDSTYSSQKIEQLLSAKIDSTLVYLKTEIDNLLALKQELLVSGTNLKTINGNSLLGSGDIAIAATSQDYQVENRLFVDRTRKSIGPSRIGLTRYSVLASMNQFHGMAFVPAFDLTVSSLMVVIQDKSTANYTHYFYVYEANSWTSSTDLNIIRRLYFSLPSASVASTTNEQTITMSASTAYTFQKNKVYYFCSFSNLSGTNPHKFLMSDLGVANKNLMDCGPEEYPPGFAIEMTSQPASSYTFGSANIYSISSVLCPYFSLF